MARPGDSSLRREKSPSPRVLVVDDEPLIRWWLSESFGERGYEVVEAADAGSAVRATGAEPPFDLILLDFRLPDSNDLSLLSELRIRVPDARIILMTAYGTPEVERRALEIGADGIIAKPFQFDDLFELGSDDS
jgi:DNA-binding response OmpR family regulator